MKDFLNKEERQLLAEKLFMNEKCDVTEFIKEIDRRLLFKREAYKEFLVTSFDGAMSVYNYGIKLWDTCPAPSNEIDKNGNELAPFYKAGALYQATYNPYVDEWIDVQLLAHIDKTEELRRLDEILCEIFFED